jgi:hypothetical protein
MQRSSRIALRLIGAVIALIGVTAVGWNLWTHRVLNTAKVRIRQAGLPTTFDELRPPAVPDETNAAPLLVRMGRLLDSEAYKGPSDGAGIGQQLSTFDEHHPKYRLEPAAAEELAAILARPVVREILALGREAAARPAYDPGLDYAQGASLTVPHIPTLRATMVLLRAHARLAASRGAADETGRQIADMFALAELPGQEPSLVSLLTRYACLNIAVEALEKIASTQALNEVWAARFSAHLRALDLRTGLLRSLDAERIGFGGHAFEGMIAGRLDAAAGFIDTNEPDHKTRRIVKLVPSGFFRLEYAEYLDRMRAMRLELADRTAPFTPQLERLEAITATVPRHHALVGLVMPTLQNVVEKSFRFSSKLAAASTGLALHRYQLAHGRTPESLDRLEPEFLPSPPIDPFTGQRQTYRRTEAGGMVYSLGQNQRDDGGVFAPDDDKDDFAWRFESTTAPVPR